MFVHGIIRYVDTFGVSHFTRLRLMIGGSVGVAEGGQPASCSEGNETDDDELLAGRAATSSDETELAAATL
jgi:hypothetical protein